MIRFENLDKFVFDGVGSLDTPKIEPIQMDVSVLEWIPFNYALTAKDRKSKGVHFYLDDYQFQRVWNDPDRYTKILSEFGAVTTPDFSQYTDTPIVLRMYNHYRKHWMGAYWQLNGINVIPTICWSDKKSYDWCFDGEPTNSIISISSVGTQKNAESKELFLSGCKKAIERLKPKEILWYGKEIEGLDCKVTSIKPYQDTIKERVKNGR